MLPADRYVASLLGLTDEQYKYWKDYVRAKAQEGPQPSVVCGDPATTIAIVSLVLTVIGTGLQIIGALLQPKPGRPAEIDGRETTGRNQKGITSFAPRAGFDAVQDVAAIGEPIPVIYANRETIGGQAYGGVRANTSLLWSQIWSLGGSQMLRAVFMIGEGKIVGLDPLGFAIGDNTIGTYDLLTAGANEIGSRLTIYYRNNGGRLVSGSRIAGRLAAQDIGNAQSDGADDVFQLKSVGGEWAPDFSASIKPSTSTTFGVYSPIGNNLGFKLNPNVRPGVTARLKPKGDDGDAKVACDKDDVVQVQRDKSAAFFSTRSGITAGTFASVGDTITYKLFRSSDYDTQFQSIGEDGDTWNTSKEIRDVTNVYGEPNYSGSTIFPGSVDLSGLLNAIQLQTPPTLNTTDKTLTLGVVADKSNFESIYQNASFGQYIVKYWIKASNNDRDIDFRIKLNVVVTVRALRKYIRNSSGDSIDFNNSTFSIGAGIDQDGLINKQVDINFGLPEDQDSYSNVSTAPNGDLSVDIIFRYKNSDIYSEKADDAASSVLARQRGWDDAIVIGEIYKIGSCLAVCSARSPENAIFRSDAELEEEDSGETITATFKVVRPGQAAVYTTSDLEADGLQTIDRKNATNGPHLMRVAVANIATTRDCRIIEIGIRSSLGIRISGLMRFRKCLTFAEADGRACENYEGDTIKSGDKLKTDQYQSGVTSTSEERYSFFRVSVRKYSDASFTPLNQCFGVVSITQQPVFNYIRLEMPEEARWEFRIEPLTGWEIRESIATGALCVLNATLTGATSYHVVTTSTSYGTIKAYFNGVNNVTRSGGTFALRQTKRDSMGLPHVDTGSNYADAWGKLAEFFVYEEIQSSASNGPEHEIVYVNEIVENTTAPLYDGIALVGINVRSAFEWAQFRQFSGYVNQGAEIRRLLNGLSLGASHLFPDVALDRFTNEKYGPGRIDDSLIDIPSFTTAAQWCYDNRYFFDGPVMLGSNSPRQWAADVAATMLLDFRETGGIYSLSPALSFSAIQHKALFTAGNIQEGTFKFETIPVDDLKPVRVSAKWREERAGLDPNNPGLFPVEREVLVTEAAPYGSDSDPIESVDLSSYVTNEKHAIDVCKFRIRAKRLRDHTVSFEITYDALEGVCSELFPGDYIKVAMDTTVYNQFNNGAVLSNGQIVCSTPLDPGTYNVIAWDGTSNDPADATLAVNSDGKGSPTGIVFTVKSSTTQVRTYQISKITPVQDGRFSIEAVHAPVNENSVLLIAAGWNNSSNWVIES